MADDMETIILREDIDKMQKEPDRQLEIVEAAAGEAAFLMEEIEGLKAELELLLSTRGKRKPKVRKETDNGRR